ncbi:MAG: hypothetical protein FWB93_01270, partial [Oscillospiraceae bacterium]|nr:hypothetical protein [Oscillospiraceae bacterium]
QGQDNHRTRPLPPSWREVAMRSIDGGSKDKLPSKWRHGHNPMLRAGMETRPYRTTMSAPHKGYNLHPKS